MTTKTMDCSGFAIFDEEGKVLLVHQTYGKKKWCLPGGQQFEGESAWDTAIRNVKKK
ncbi:NUDIX hydrolase [Paenibacillus glucanolyticus]|uniref:NUDIX hydrolase n=1 Tax=Paenibacillus glucanolyticus TaxID=59843 RepID=UPI0035DEC719